MIVAHGGDTLSPSLMSGLDRGAHIVALTNMIAPDIFVPGNHEFDFGKAMFLERMAEAKFPLYAANLRDADGAAAAGLQGSLDRHVRRRAHRPHRRGLRAVAAHASSPEDLQFLPTVDDHQGAGRGAAPRGRGFRLRGRACQSRRGLSSCMATRTIDLLLTGHTHDLFVNFDGRTARWSSSSYDAHYVTASTSRSTVREDGGKRIDDLVAAVPRDRHRDRDARSRGRGRGRALRAGTDRQDELDGRSAPPRSSSTAAPRPCARARPRSAICSPTRCARRRTPTPR